MGLASYHQLGMLVGATEVSTTVETQVASPFSMEQLRAKGDAIIKGRNAMSKYYVLALEPISQNRDTKSHVEAFDVASPPDPVNHIYETDAEARDAAIVRVRELEALMPPYCYVAFYHTSDDPPRIDDKFVPPPQQSIETKSFTTKQKIAAGASLLGVIGILALIAKH